MRVFLTALSAAALAVFVGPLSFSDAHAQESAASAPDQSALQAVYEAFVAKPGNKSRKALSAELDAYAGAPTTLSIKAHMARVNEDSDGNGYRQLRKSSQAAIQHIEPVAGQIMQVYADLRLVSAVALFNDTQDKDAVYEMAHLKGWLGELKASEESAQPEWINPLYWRSEAWLLAMNAYYSSARKTEPSEEEIESILALYEPSGKALEFKSEPIEAEDDGLPFCGGELNMSPKLSYPRGNARKGMFGSVILRFGYDDEGGVIGIEPLAAIPIDGFKDDAARTVKKWKWIPDEGQAPGIDCTLERSNVVLPLVYAFGR